MSRNSPRFPISPLVLLLALCAPIAIPAQTFDLANSRIPIVSLDGLWRFHPGDNIAWADPGFDDSEWPLLRSDRDWAVQGFRNMSGYAWYRFAVDVPAGFDSISLTLPRIMTSYEVYADGKLIGAYGKMPPDYVVNTGGQGKTFHLPRATLVQQRIQIAIRVWHWPIWARQYGGGPATERSLIGTTDAITHQNGIILSATLFHFSPGMLAILLELLASAGALTLYFQRRSEREYLWFGVLMLARAGYDFATLLHEFVPAREAVYAPIRVTLMFAVIPLAEMYFYGHLLNAVRTAWFRVVFACLLLTLLVAASFLWPHGQMFFPGTQVVLTLLSTPQYIWVLTLLFTRARENFTDAQLLLVPALLQKLALIWNRVGATTFTLGWQRRFGLLTMISTEPVRIDLLQVANAIFLLTVFAILAFRFTRTRSREERYSSEVQSARSVQQYLIPERLPDTPGLAIESVYRPSREVGGDFFQVLPNPKEGSVLIVVGDVAGKGLQAGMSATLIVGAIRVAVTFTTDPEKILALLNERLQGRGLVTCLVLRIESDGNAILANAGHLPPYLNSKEMPMEGALPLGAVPRIEFPVMRFQLAPGDSLMLMSDGIAEAQNADGALFGFERIGEMLSRHATASAVAAAAQAFGQEDDITVLTVARTLPAVAA